MKNPIESSFIPFSRLPSELRDEIWTASFPLFASQVTIQVLGLRNPGGSQYRYSGWRRMSGPHRTIPPLLHTCHESRLLALQYYEKGFMRTDPLERYVPHSIARKIDLCDHFEQELRWCENVCWDPNLDIIILKQMDEKITTTLCPETAWCRSLHVQGWWGFDEAVKVIGIEDSLWGKKNGIEWLGGFPGLRELRIFVNRESMHSGFWRRGRVGPGLDEKMYEDAKRCKAEGYSFHLSNFPERVRTRLDEEGRARIRNIKVRVLDVEDMENESMNHSMAWE
jgi:hypothetical protein